MRSWVYRSLGEFLAADPRRARTERFGWREAPRNGRIVRAWVRRATTTGEVYAVYESDAELDPVVLLGICRIPADELRDLVGRPESFGWLAREIRRLDIEGIAAAGASACARQLRTGTRAWDGRPESISVRSQKPGFTVHLRYSANLVDEDCGLVSQSINRCLRDAGLDRSRYPVRIEIEHAGTAREEASPPPENELAHGALVFNLVRIYVAGLEPGMELELEDTLAARIGVPSDAVTAELERLWRERGIERLPVEEGGRWCTLPPPTSVRSLEGHVQTVRRGTELGTVAELAGRHGLTGLATRIILSKLLREGTVVRLDWFWFKSGTPEPRDEIDRAARLLRVLIAELGSGHASCPHCSPLRASRRLSGERTLVETLGVSARALKRARVLLETRGLLIKCQGCRRYYKALGPSPGAPGPSS